MTFAEHVELLRDGDVDTLRAAAMYLTALHEVLPAAIAAWDAYQDDTAYAALRGPATAAEMLARREVWEVRIITLFNRLSAVDKVLRQENNEYRALALERAEVR